MQAKQLYFLRLGLDEDAKPTYMTKAYQMKITLEDSQLFKLLKVWLKIIEIMVPIIRWDQQRKTLSLSLSMSINPIQHISYTCFMNIVETCLDGWNMSNKNLLYCQYKKNDSSSETIPQLIDCSPIKLSSNNSTLRLGQNQNDMYKYCDNEQVLMQIYLTKRQALVLREISCLKFLVFMSTWFTS